MCFEECVRVLPQTDFVEHANAMIIITGRRGNRVNEYWMKRDLTNVFVVYFRNNGKNTTYALLCNKSNPG